LSQQPSVGIVRVDVIDISVVIPCFNHGEYILDAIASVEASSEVNYELIIINDGSTDTYTLGILHELRDRGYHVVDLENQGLANARNHGISLASGRYILPLDSDNKIRPDYMHKGIDKLDACPEIGIVYGDVEFFGETTGVWALPDFDLYRLMLGNFIDACAVFRKQVWQDCGGYDTNIPDKLGYEDWDFWLSAAESGWQFWHVPEVMFDYRTRSDSMVQTCKQPINQKRLVHYICAKHIDLYTPRLADAIADKEFVAFERMLEIDRLRLELQKIQLEVERSRDRPQKTEEDLQAIASEVGHLRATIEAMETSKFWQLRQVWFKLKGWIRRE
jgi:glycosyltransferase involved in cell wall biosynthesis